MTQVRRIAGALWREAVARSGPHGLVHVGYLRRRPEPLVALHRALWLDALPGWPRWVFGLVEANLWLRWMLYGAWWATWRVVRRRGAQAREADGVSPARQAARVLGLALRWCIPPAQAYQLGLHVPPSPGAEDPALRYVFAGETHAWHRSQSPDTAARAEAVALLRDKSALASRLAAVGIRVVETLVSWQGGEAPALDDWLTSRLSADALAPPGLFFKLRNGARSEGAFAAWRHAGQWMALRSDDRAIHGADGVQALWAALCARGEVLVQPRLVSHPELPVVSASDAVTTVRVITQRVNGCTRTAMAMLEVPRGRDGLHEIWPIDPADGRLGAGSKAGERVPDWNDLDASSCRAHEVLGALASVAWDWAITRNGPLLLEGNSLWRLAQPQRLFGPLLQLQT